jgi:transcriptional regulator with XRE-family HTH domain
MTFRLRGLMAKTGETASMLAKECGLPPSTVTRFFSGKTRTPRLATVAALADHFHVSTAFLLGLSEEAQESAPFSGESRVVDGRLVPVADDELLKMNYLFGEVSLAHPTSEWARLPPDAEGDAGEVVGAVRVCGDAMAPLICDGDMAFISYDAPQTIPSGSVVIAGMKDDDGSVLIVIRRLMKAEGGRAYLHADNPRWTEGCRPAVRVFGLVIARSGRIRKPNP